MIASRLLQSSRILSSLPFWLISLTLSFRLRAAEPVRSHHGMVVSSQGLASEVGVQVLREGGNAVDAAVATGLALAVTHPSAGNIGGGGFMLVFTKNGTVTAFDFREKAPLAATEGMYLGADGQYVPDSSHEGYRAIGVPGTVAGFDLALKRFGTRSWHQLTAPAVKLAKDGFILCPALAGEFTALHKEGFKNRAAESVFLHANGSEYKSGERWKQPLLAKTLERIQSKGPAGFYSGATARAIAADMRAHGGLITEADLNAYEAKERVPIHGTFRGYDIYSMPPPSSGGTALVEMLNILEGYPLATFGHNTPQTLHLMAESMRRAFADRAQYLGDPDFNSAMPIPRLISKEHAVTLRQSIRLDHASPSDPARFAEAYESPETTHYSVIDTEGNAVVVTYTLEYSYGSRIMAEGLGFLYNNEMGDFGPQPGRTDTSGMIGTPPNRIAPGKRMLSSMSPTIVARDGKPVLLIGSPGGRTIINTVLQVVLNVVEFRMNIADAIAAPRMHHQWLPNTLLLEKRAFPESTRRELESRGHAVKESAPIGQAMGITVDPKTGLRSGASDPRSPDGKAVGY